MRKFVTLKAPEGFRPCRVLATWQASYWTISRRSYRKACDNLVLRFVAPAPHPYRNVIRHDCPILVED